MRIKSKGDREEIKRVAETPNLYYKKFKKLCMIIFRNVNGQTNFIKKLLDNILYQVLTRTRRGYEQKFAWACVERLKTLWGPLVVTLALCSSSKRRKRTPLGLTDPPLMAKDLGGSASISRRISRLARNTIFGLVSREEHQVWGNNCVSVGWWKIEPLEINRASL